MKAYPQNLLLANRSDVIQLILMNATANPERFKVFFQPEGLEISANLDFSSNYVEFAPNEQKEVALTVKPTQDGRVRLSVTGYREKQVEYIDKDKQVRPATTKITSDEIPVEDWNSFVPTLPPDDINSFPIPAGSKHTAESLQTEYQLATLSGTSPDANLEKDQKLADVAIKYAEIDPVKFREIFDSISDPSVKNDLIPRAINVLIPRFPKPGLEMIKEFYDKTVSEDQLVRWAHQLLDRGIDQGLWAAELIEGDEQRDQLIAHLCSRYLVRDIPAAVDALGKITDTSLRALKKAEFIRFIASKDPDGAIQLAEAIQDENIRDQALVEIIKIISISNLSKAAQGVKKIANEAIRDALSQELARQSVNREPGLVNGLITNISSIPARLDVTLQVAPNLFVADPSVGKNLFKSSLDLTGQLPDPELIFQYKSKLIESIASAVDPQIAHEHLETLDDALRNRITESIFDSVYQWVEVKKVRIEDELAVNLFYVYNALVTDLNESIRRWSEGSGNISENVLSGKMDAIISTVLLFPYSFPILQILDQVYNVLQFQHQKEFNYFNYPSRDLRDETEQNIVSGVLNRFLAKRQSQLHGTHTVFNLDFIPQLQKPTIIMGSDLEVNTAVQSAVRSAFPQGDVDFIVDDGLFEGGAVFHELTQILKSPQFKVINLVLTYDFLNDLEKMVKFLLAFIR